MCDQCREMDDHMWSSLREEEGRTLLLALEGTVPSKDGRSLEGGDPSKLRGLNLKLDGGVAYLTVQMMDNTRYVSATYREGGWSIDPDD